jgi:hypothetical protein
MIVSTKIAKMFKQCGFVNIDYLVKNRLETNPSKILNVLNRDWRKWVKPVCMLDGGGLDPNFGYETAGGTEKSCLNRITGSVFTTSESGTADSITAYIRATDPYYSEYGRYKYAIYKHSDLSLVGVTEEGVVPGGGFADAWKTLNFTEPKPSLTASIEYILVSWGLPGPQTDVEMHYNAGDVNQGHYQSLAYDTFPDPLVPTHENNKYSIYCTYTAAAVGIASKRLLVGVGL